MGILGVKKISKWIKETNIIFRFLRGFGITRILKALEHTVGCTSVKVYVGTRMLFQDFIKSFRKLWWI
jgi:hypothetical protein